MKNREFDAIVVGGGPAGNTCSLFLADAGLKVLLLEKEVFPRDKTCADNKSWVCTSIVKELGLWEKFQSLPKQEITQMLFSSPAGHEMLVELEKEKIEKDGPHYNVRRLFFDDFLFQAAKKRKNIQVIEGFLVEGAIFEEKKVVGVKGKNPGGKIEEFFSKIVVGADGSTSPFSMSVGINPIVSERHALSARAYFSGVKFLPNTVELHYLKGVCPGYFWIFPVDNGLCNVGVGLQTIELGKKGKKIDELLAEIIYSQKFAQRFSAAKQVSKTSVWGLTVGLRKRKVFGNGFVLCGDAANTSVTFAGEGVGPAMRSGKIAAQAIIGAFEKNDFSEKTLSTYGEELWRVIGPENNAMKNMEFLTTHPALYDFVVKKTKNNPQLLALASEIGSDYKNASKIFSLKTILALLKN